MRVVVVAGMPGSGKTSMISRCADSLHFSFIANNDASAGMLAGRCGSVDVFPFKSPCARVRQFRYRVDLMRGSSPELVVSEPPGGCLDVSSPMLNPIYVDKTAAVGPLITAVDCRRLAEGISKRSTEGLRLWNMIDESDIVAATFADLSDTAVRDAAAIAIASVNPDAEVVFVSSVTGEGVQKICELITDAEYRRPLFN